MTAMPSLPVLIVSDDGELLRTVLEVLAGAALRGVVARDARLAAKRLAACDFHLVLVDLDLEGGAQLVSDLRRDWPEPAVIAFSRDDRAEPAVRALRDGCLDYQAKPVDKPRLGDCIRRFMPNHPVPLAAGEEQAAWRIAGASPRLLETLALARRVAATTMPVLMTGESGTGKELISYLVHRHSVRRDGPYIRVNCAALSESLLESELFGHERGAFTGAYQQRKGRFEMAHGGTLLLDEISETTPRLQAELLRVLEQQDFERVGGSQSVRVNVRILCTSNRDLAREVDQGRFRSDLFYRISGVHLVVPPLRERLDDIPALVWHFVNLYAREVRRSIRELDSAVIEAFEQCSWPGNVRQLRNIVRTALVLGSGPVLSLEGVVPNLEAQLGYGEHNLASPLPREASPRPQARGPAQTHPATPNESLRLDQVERRAILEALRRTESHQAKAARLLGITDRTLREKLRRYRQEQPAPSQARRQAGEGQWLGQPA